MRESHPSHHVKDFADARARGMRLTVVDPIGGYAEAKADEWVPIRPGTDAAFALALMDVLLNELRIFDAEFLKRGSNAPYLVAEDGYYLQSTGSGKPLVFDSPVGVAKDYDDPTIKDLAMEGSYQVKGIPAAPAFELLKRARCRAFAGVGGGDNHGAGRHYPETGRGVWRRGPDRQHHGPGREGIPLPPVSVDWARGPQGHRHGFRHDLNHMDKISTALDKCVPVRITRADRGGDTPLNPRKGLTPPAPPSVD